MTIQLQDSMESLADICRFLYKKIGIVSGKNKYYEYYACQLFLGYYNRLMINALPEDEDTIRKVIDEAINIATDKNHPMLITFIPEKLPWPIEQYLKEKGLTLKYDQAAMGFDTAEKQRNQQEKVKEIHINQLSEFGMVCDKVFGKKPDERIYSELFCEPNVKFYAIEESEKIVSTGMSYLNSNTGNLGIHNITTLEQCRGKGYASRIVSEIIRDAQDMKVQKVTLQASKLGEPLYVRLGFKRYGSLLAYGKE